MGHVPAVTAERGGRTPGVHFLSGIQVTLGLPPAGIFWQRTGGSSSPKSLPSPRRSFVPCFCSAHLGASSRGLHRGPRPHRFTARPLATVTRPSRGNRAQKPEPSSLLHAGLPHPSLGRGDNSRAPGVFFPGLARVLLVRKLQRMVKRPLPPSPPLSQGRKRPPFVFDSRPTLHGPSSSRRRRQPLLIQGAEHRRKSIRDKNQLLPECAAAIDTRARRVAPFSQGSSSNSDSAREGGG